MLLDLNSSAMVAASTLDITMQTDPLLPHAT